MFPFWFCTSRSSGEWGRRPIINVGILVRSKSSWKRECLFFFFHVMLCFILRNVAAEVVPGCCARYPAWICSVFKTRGKAARSHCLWDCLKWLTQQRRRRGCSDEVQNALAYAHCILSQQNSSNTASKIYGFEYFNGSKGQMFPFCPGRACGRFKGSF